MARPARPVLNRQRIIEAATAIIDAEGLPALSTRRLARELRVQAPSLYNHFATKEEILDAVGDSIIAQVDLSMFGRDHWPEALRRWARAYRAAFSAHPHIVPFLIHGPGRRPAALALAEAVYGTLIEAGWPPRHATRIGATMRFFIAGSALGSFALGFPDDPGLYDRRYPHLADAHRLREHRQEVDDGAFELGLDLLVNGFVTLHDQLARGLPADPALRADLGEKQGDMPESRENHS